MATTLNRARFQISATRSTSWACSVNSSNANCIGMQYGGGVIIACRRAVNECE